MQSSPTNLGQVRGSRTVYTESFRRDFEDFRDVFLRRPKKVSKVSEVPGSRPYGEVREPPLLPKVRACVNLVGRDFTLTPTLSLRERGPVGWNSCLTGHFYLPPVGSEGERAIVLRDAAFRYEIRKLWGVVSSGAFDRHVVWRYSPRQ